MKTAALILVLFLPTSAFALCDDWHTSDTVLGSTWTILALQDWQQTKNFRAEGRAESNPILGKYPSQEKVDLYIGSAIIGGWAIACILPHEARLFWFGVWAFVEFEATQYSSSQGVKGIYGVSLPLVRF